MSDDPTALLVLGRRDLEQLRAILDQRPAPDAPVTLSVTETARQLGISRSHAYDLIRSGDIPHVRLGRRIVVPRGELDALLHRNRPANDAAG